MKPIIFSLAAIFSLSAAPAAVFSLSGTMDVLQAGTNGTFGTGTGNGTGVIAGSYDDVSNLMSYTVTWQDLSGPVTAAHFHIAPPGSGGSPAVTLSAPLTSPNSGTDTLTAGEETSLLTGDFYANLHTSAFGGGEIRGQVLASPVPEPSSSLFLLGGIGASLLRRRRA